jgi:hypothetical protein
MLSLVMNISYPTFLIYKSGKVALHHVPLWSLGINEVGRLAFVHNRCLTFRALILPMLTSVYESLGPWPDYVGM